MATLVPLSSGEEFALPPRCLIGRAPTSHLVLLSEFASSDHARINWNGVTWEIRDLGSSNGTFVDGERIEPGAPVTIGPGSKLGFGDERPAWELLDADPPGPAATDLESNDSHTADQGILVLPDLERPEASVYADPKGQGWFLEDAEGETRFVSDGEVIRIGNRMWRLELPVASTATPLVNLALSLDNVTLRIAVSSDEERVKIAVVLRGKETHTLEPREHSYLLLTLARARQAEADKPEKDRGWVDMPKLVRMLRTDENAIYVATHRIRQQFAGIGMEGATGIVQVRRGKRRIGTDRFEIGVLEA